MCVSKRYSLSLVKRVAKEGFGVKGKENLVCRLKKSLCSLKPAPRLCYKNLTPSCCAMGIIGQTHIIVCFLRSS